MNAVEMPDRVAENLVIFIRQVNGTLPRKRLESEFKKLRATDVTLIEGFGYDVLGEQ